MVSQHPDPYDRPLTHHDLEVLPADGNRYEVIDGELYLTPFPSSAHQHVVAQLLYLVQHHVRQDALGMVFPPGFKVVLDEPTGVGPDLVYLSNARLSDLRADGFYGAPDLVVEVLSSKPILDRVVKRKKYAQAGIPYYWISDAEAHRLSAYKLAGARYEIEIELQGEDLFDPELFPGLTIPLAELWL